MLSIAKRRVFHGAHAPNSMSPHQGPQRPVCQQRVGHGQTPIRLKGFGLCPHLWEWPWIKAKWAISEVVARTAAFKLHNPSIENKQIKYGGPFQKGFIRGHSWSKHQVNQVWIKTNDLASPNRSALRVSRVTTSLWCKDCWLASLTVIHLMILLMLEWARVRTAALSGTCVRQHVILHVMQWDWCETSQPKLVPLPNISVLHWIIWCYPKLSHHPITCPD